MTVKELKKHLNSLSEEYDDANVFVGQSWGKNAENWSLNVFGYSNHPTAQGKRVITIIGKKCPDGMFDPKWQDPRNNREFLKVFFNEDRELKSN